MAGVGLGGFFSGDPNPNPFADIIPNTGAIVGDNGQIIVDDPSLSEDSFADQDGYDPPTGNGILNPAQRFEHAYEQGMVSPERARYNVGISGLSKLDELKMIEEDIRDLLLRRKKLLGKLKTERDEINERLNVSESVTTALDEMFPEQLEKEIESGVIDG